MWQRTITELPPELLAMIFDYLEFDDIRHVNATCLAFREVVTQYNIQELSYFARLPQSFREQYQQNASWQRKYLHLHPFATSASLNNRVISLSNRIIKKLSKMPALLCLATLGKMEQCPSYHPVKRYKVILPLSVARYRSYRSNRNDDADPAYDVCFSPSSRYLLFYGSCLNDARILSRNDQGQWAEAQLNWSDDSGSRVITGANFTACEDRLLTISADRCVNTLQPAHRFWEDVSKVTLSNKTVKFSPSGKFMATYSTNDTAIWRLDENNDWLKMEVCGLCPEVIVGQVLFSPSEQHVALRGSNEITVLSLNDSGAWSAQQLIKFSRIDGFTHRISYASFSQVADELLVGICSHSTSPGRVSIFSPEPSGKWQE
ncbi:F-box protein, partial [Endozoicomonas sp. ONNA2]|uniref:F-box protein n=1 Tax=Endozoicomonas sp. ONNA2 TaxID=2828741 RepID=UPI00214740A1